MKYITLTDKEAEQLDIYLELTSGRIEEEIKIWQGLQGKTPLAESNINFWKASHKAVNSLRKELR